MRPKTLYAEMEKEVKDKRLVDPSKLQQVLAYWVEAEARAMRAEHENDNRKTRHGPNCIWCQYQLAEWLKAAKEKLRGE